MSTPRYLPLSLLPLAFAATTATAELSAEAVWSDWKSYFEGLGYTVSAQERIAGGRLDVSNMKVTVSIPEDDAEVIVGLDAISFEEQDDGTVRIDMSEEMSIAFSADPDAGEDVSGTLSFLQSGLDFTASGSIEELTYDYNVATVEMLMNSMTVNGVQLSDEIFAMRFTGSDMTSSTLVKNGDIRDYTQTATMSALAWDLNFADPEGNEGKLKMKGSVQGVSFDGDGKIPDVGTDNASAMIAAGFDFSGGYAFTSGNNEATFDGANGSGTLNSTSEGGKFSVTMSKDGMGYQTEQRALSVNGLFTELPFPVTLQAERAAFNFIVPTVKSPDSQDFGALISMENFSVSDMIWSLVDPAGQLPRDPATLTVDLAGKAKLLFDYLDPAQAEIMGQTGAAPGELEGLTLQTLLLQIAGAKLTGQGDFTFDNADVTTFNGMPRPEGALDLQLEGGNGLLDKLVSIGLLPEDQAMGARMMMGLFARPGEGPDSLVSKIEVNAQGHVLANGQRIQ